MSRFGYRNTLERKNRFCSWAGLAVSFFFSVASVLASDCQLSSRGPSVCGSPASLEISAPQDGISRTFTWDFGDGSTPVLKTTTGQVNHTYAQPGHYSVVVNIAAETGASSRVMEHTVYRPRTELPPANASSIVYDEAQDCVFLINPDNDTLAVIDGEDNTLLSEILIPAGPRTLAMGPDNSVWIACMDAAVVVVYDATSLELRHTIAMPRASQPFGIVISPDRRWAYVTLQATGEIARLDTTTGKLESRIKVGPTPRAIAVTADSATIFASRFISPQDHGEIYEVDAATFTLKSPRSLSPDQTPDSDRSGRGVPNYLMTIALTPDGTQAWIGSKKDNVFRGLARDGETPTFESTVRSLVMRLDLATGKELPKLDINDLDLPAAIAFNRLGNLAFVATHGSRTVQVIDAYKPERTITSLDNLGLGVSGLALDSNGTILYVQCWLERTVEVYDLSGIVDRTTNKAKQLAIIPTVTEEKLPAKVLQGKRVFHDAADRRMIPISYMSCASCHLEGDGDGRNWDFTNRGEGIRNTTDLRGRRGMGHGPVHWTANFDEIQDFENDIRSHFTGKGFMPNDAFHQGTRSETLGDPKAGLSTELDAMAAYLTSLEKVPPSPFREQDGTLTSAAIRGKAVFEAVNCASCHSGPDFTDSPSLVRHDVGTLQKTSGQRLDKPLDGLDTPTLKGVWATEPYLHDGSAATLTDVILRAQADPQQRHGQVKSLTTDQVADLVAYLEQLDETNKP
jgi:DNA-binding beta-propeller fold protein YncE/cytochrome c peroxidase